MKALTAAGVGSVTKRAELLISLNSHSSRPLCAPDSIYIAKLVWFCFIMSAFGVNFGPEIKFEVAVKGIIVSIFMRDLT